MKTPQIRLRRKATPKSHGTVFLPPGTISYVGADRSGAVSTETISYDTNHFVKEENIYTGTLQENWVYWYNIDGVHDIEVLEKVGEKFNLHHLLLEDIANTTQRPKTEFYGDYIFQCIKMISYDPASNELTEEQVSIVLTKNSVITFQEKTGDVFENIRDRIENSKGRIRSVKNDYLFYALIDSIIDHYFIAIEQIGDYLDHLEDEIFEDPQKDSLNKAQKNKRLLLSLRKAIYPLRESISRLLKEDSPLIESRTHAYLQDAYDHCIQIIETVESYREINAGLRDMYLSSVSHKMNQVMQVLTIVSSLFIPMTFVAGIYGMNFEHIPELTWEHGYEYFWVINAVIFIGLLIFFRWKKWI
jgi:magnesium transporter